MSAANSMGPERMAWVMEADRLIRSGKSIDAVAAILGKKVETISRNLRYLKNSLPTKAPEPPKETAPDNIIKILRAGTTLDGLGKQLGVSARVAKAHIDDLTEQGMCVDEQDGVYRLSSVPHAEPQIIDRKWKGDKIIRFGLLGDTQINSKYTQITHLHAAYDVYKAEGITTVYHTGDIDDGEKMRKGHEYEIYNHGADDHIAEIVRVYPKIDGITTEFLCGNHDAAFVKQIGLDIGVRIQAERPDMIYRGMDQAYINLTPNCTMELRHPGDGTAYALSYKIQKMIEAMSGGEKPNILAVGHYHKQESFEYRNVQAIQTGCLQAQTGWMRGKSIAAMMGFYIIEVKVNEDGQINEFVPRWRPFYQAIKDDYKNWQ